MHINIETDINDIRRIFREEIKIIDVNMKQKFEPPIANLGEIRIKSEWN